MQDTVGERVALSSLRKAPVDLVLIGTYVVLVTVVTLSAVEDTLVGGLIQAIFVGFVPGYALVAALFPKANTTGDTVHGNGQGRGGRITRLERLALSIAASGGLLALAAGTLLGIFTVDTATALVLALAVVTIGLAAVATVRRLVLSPSERFGRSVVTWIDLLSPGGTTRSNRGWLSRVALGFVVLFVLTSVAYAMAPAQEDGYTELYLLHEDGGERISQEYPDELTVGEEQSLIVGIGNQEGTTETYTVVVRLQEIETDGSQTHVRSSTELDRFEVTLRSGETVETEHAIAPDRTGENLRLTYSLYEGSPPESADAENAYRSAYIWVDVTEPDD